MVSDSENESHSDTSDVVRSDSNDSQNELCEISLSEIDDTQQLLKSWKTPVAVMKLFKSEYLECHLQLNFR